MTTVSCSTGRGSNQPVKPENLEKIHMLCVYVCIRLGTRYGEIRKHQEKKVVCLLAALGRPAYHLNEKQLKISPSTI